ncbi:MAG TPA: phosphatase PAP2/dual specificity phosphatase family protein, partial [Chthoniobacterales bacterium]
MIVPYMSIDLFFVAAPLLCRTSAELNTFAKRIASAIVAAGICFLLFPLRFAFERPQASGVHGAIFDWFRGMDLPYNLFPSLHIALSALLVVTYARHTRGAVRALLVAWFVLIIASAVLTFQHHVLDVVGGFALGGYCFYFIREMPVRLPVAADRVLALRYFIGSFALALAGLAFWPWGALLLWPAASLAIVAAAYLTLGPTVFRKTHGVVPRSTRWALGPFLVGQHLSRIYYRRQCRAWDEVTPQVWIGSALREDEARRAVNLGVAAVLDLTAEFTAAKAFRHLSYRNVQVLDLTAPTYAQLEEISEFITEHSQHGIVYVHCKIGYSRSAAAVIAWLIASAQVDDVAEGIERLRKTRPSIVIRPEIHRALAEFCARRRVRPQALTTHPS